MEDDVHRKEVTADSEKGFKTQLLLDAVVDAEEIKIEDQELIEYLAFTSRNYQMDPNQFIEQVASSGQVAFYADELARRKAVDFLVAQAVITDTKGAAVKYEV
jgi:trigger factor